MSLVVGNVSVADDGTETFTPNDATSWAKAFYVMLMSVNSTAKVQKKSSGGPATWTPPKPTLSNPPTAPERAAFAAWQAGNPVMTPPPPPTTSTVTHTITPDATSKQKMAEMANGFASVVVSMLLANAVVSITIPASSAGNGLQTSQNPGDPTTHPATPKTMTGGLT